MIKMNQIEKNRKVKGFTQDIERINRLIRTLKEQRIVICREKNRALLIEVEV